MPRRIAIIGAGIGGLAAAWRAHRTGAEVVVFEASDRLGGTIQSEQHGEWLIERGPHTLQMRPDVADIIAALPIKPLVAGDGRRLNRYVVRGGRLVPLPMGPGSLLFTNFFSGRSKFRLARLIAGKTEPPSEDESFADFVRRQCGEEVLTWAAQPFVSGIYAGNPELLSTEYAFPRLWAALKQRRSALGGSGAAPLISFPNGLTEVVNALAEPLPFSALRLKTIVQGLVRNGGRWRIEDLSEAGEFDEVLVSLPAKAASGLRIDGDYPLRFLEAIPHPPVTVLNVGFRRSDVRHPLDGFGFLVPSVERRLIMGVIFTSTLFPGRAPSGHVAMTVMLGGALQPDCAKLTEADAWQAAQVDVRELLGVSAATPAFLEATHYESAIPQYTLAHGELLQKMKAAESAHSGLWLGGNYRGGISLPDRLNQTV
ncbi:MAG TPA: protoporphyrinogen oxidase [Opitutaceae bacterium]|jgi:oxygen-dependent protoporphyrinogen oxidase